ncbi:ZIP zinc transporter-domain-containing protein [Lipomyces oligophaga]|uniref:ZIP zinc transporter-domain-containing protein n=1 Tax=Lipomyces oligophaga TaxID=45792 RepID=UPI0034CEC975
MSVFGCSVRVRMSLLCLLGFAAMTTANRLLTDTGAYDMEYIDEGLAKCAVVQELDQLKRGSLSTEIGVVQKMFNKLFPFGPGANALLATTYISGPPNLFLALIPPNIDPSSLSILVAFAVGGLLGDVFFHLMPETFLGESHDPARVRFVLVEDHRNTLLGAAIFLGFGAFIVLDKVMRIFAGGEDSHSHGHSHSHTDVPITTSSSTSSSEVISDGPASNLRSRSKNTELEASAPIQKEQRHNMDESEPSASVKLSAYLNLIADFSHNITDGLAIAASFYISHSVGATTTLAVFFHEIPHEVGDFALLVQGGFSKQRAMGAQFITAVGAYVGTFIGIGIQLLSADSSSAGSDTLASSPVGLFGTTCTVGDLVLPFTAGGFLYIGTVGVIPEILETDSRLTKIGEIKKGFWQAIAMILGAGMMFAISWTE